MKIHGLTPLLQVFDLGRSTAFYRDLLGFRAVSWSHTSENDSYWGMLMLGDVALMLNSAYEDDERPPEPDAARVKAHADTTLFFGCDNADDVYAHLRSAGCDAQPPSDTHYGMRQVYAKDPDGYHLCFQHPISQPGVAHSSSP